MKQIMEKNNLKTLKQLQKYKQVGMNCKLCVAYIEKMIETGRTEFKLDDVPSPNL
jgi:bacterioferritin-associated ferredoxin